MIMHRNKAKARLSEPDTNKPANSRVKSLIKGKDFGITDLQRALWNKKKERKKNDTVIFSTKSGRQYVLPCTKI